MYIICYKVVMETQREYYVCIKEKHLGGTVWKLSDPKVSLARLWVFLIRLQTYMKYILLFVVMFSSTVWVVFWNSTDNIQYHLSQVEKVLREVDVSDLSVEQQKNRIEKLDILAEYIVRWKFPNNDINNELITIFQGSNWNLCAVWYMMNSDLEYQNYVQDIVSQNNLVRVMDIKNDEMFTNWAEKNWFSQLELAMIQPTYAYEIPWYERINILLVMNSFLSIIASTIILYVIPWKEKWRVWLKNFFAFFLRVISASLIGLSIAVIILRLLFAFYYLI